MGGSMLFLFGFLLILLFAMNPAAAIMRHPVAVLFGLSAIGAFVTSGVCVTKLGRTRTTSEPRRLWTISLFCHVGIVAIAVAAFGPALGLVLGIMELIAVSLHVYALAAPTVRAHDV
jgi:hypothetical protein